MAFWSRPAAVGLDIGTRLVKAVQLKKTGKKGFALERFGVAEIYPSGEKPASPTQQRPAILDAIKRALSQAGISSREVVTAVAGESVIVRYIPPMPEMPEQELNNALRWHAEEHIPFQIEDVNMSSAIIGHTDQGGERRMDVLLVCAKKELILDHIELLREAGLSPSVVDVDSFAFLNCFDSNYSPAAGECVGLINIGGDLTTISVYLDGMPRFSRDISIGGSTISTAISQRLKISIAEAETLKVRHGLAAKEGNTDATDAGVDSELMQTIRSTVQAMTGEADSEVSQEAQVERAIRNTLNNLVGEIRRSIHYYENHENQPRGHSVSRLCIGGGSANLTGLPEHLQRELGLPVEIVDPLKDIPVVQSSVDTKLLEEYRKSLGVGIGLALRKVVD
ncbi:MAG TPA: type IV pilus assembly protein PilM [Candidatus Sumerlaeota bacterium]|nr:type IV pilus assembly protein PilM [Candidatus Sumerlaeota bacterium]HPS01668.1 type IV pilus assembly protein PilM [Candidatus Sumerlaeota bacterium]